MRVRLDNHLLVEAGTVLRVVWIASCSLTIVVAMPWGGSVNAISWRSVSPVPFCSCEEVLDGGC